MINLATKYATEIAAMKADTEANIAEAKQLESEKATEVEQLYSTFKDIKSTAKTAHRAFFKVMLNILRLAFKRTPSPEEVSNITQPCNTYMTAASKLPEAEKNLFEAKIDLSEAYEMLSQAELDLVHINSLL